MTMNPNTTKPSQTITLDGPDTPVSAPAPAKEVFTVKGDRHPAVNLVYPEAAFMHAGKGGRLVDVTKPPFNAKGDGKTDDTMFNCGPSRKRYAARTRLELKSGLRKGAQWNSSQDR